MKYKVRVTNKFKKDRRRAEKRRYDMELLQRVIWFLENGVTLPPEYKDHALKGRRKDERECHILDDWLLIYKVYDDVLVLVLTETGTHSDLYE